MSNKYNPFLRMVNGDDDDEPTGDRSPSIPGMPPDLTKAVEKALEFSEMVNDADQEYSRAALMASRLVTMGNRAMDEVAQQQGITVENSVEENYAMRAIKAAQAARPEQLAATMQALNQGYDMAMYAFLTVYKLLNTLFNDPMVEIHVGGMGFITRYQTPEAKRKVVLMTQLQTPQEAARAKLLAAGLVEIEKSVTPSTAGAPDSAERAALIAHITEATEALYARVNEAVKDIPNQWEDTADGK